MTTEATQMATQERSIVTTRIPGRVWLDVEVQTVGKEARIVTAKWATGSIEIPVDILQRIEGVVRGSRSAIGDARGICPLHGFYDGPGWGECSTCTDEKRALIEAKAPQKMLDDAL